MKYFFVLTIILIMFKNVFSFNTSDTTNWEIEPSFKYDLFCFMNIMTGDEFYLTYYQQEYDKYKDKLTPEVRDALKSIKKKIKDDGGNIVSAWLCLYFSATKDETTDELINTLNDPVKLKNNFEQTPYFSEEGWKLFESVKSELLIVLNFLKEINFEKYWTENILPKVEVKRNEFISEVGKYNVIGNVEEHLGFKLPSNKITVYLLYYSQPHGIKITGTRFLTDIAWPFSILMRTASHEMMHPPFDIEKDTILKNTLSILKDDEYFMDKVLNHNTSFGYNSFEGFVEEDCVQALDQIINEKLGIAKDPRKRWIESDDGMHVLAISLYNIMKTENYNVRHEMFRDFLVRIVSEGKLSNGNIKKIYNEFYSE